MPIDLENDTLKIALAKLKARENSFRQFEAIAGLGSWEVDLNTKKSFWSENSYKIYGYEVGEIEPSLDIFFKHLLPEYHEEAKRKLELMMQTKEVHQFVGKSKRKDGKIIDIMLHAQVIDDESGKPLKLVGVTQDITEYSALQQETQELHDILEKSSSEIFILDLEGYRYLYVNEGAVKRLGYSKDEFLQMNVFDINPYLTKKRAHELEKKLIEEGSVINRTIHRTKSGEEYHVQSYLQKIVYRGQDAYIIFDIDITPLVELEKQQKEQAQIVENISDGVILTTLDGQVKMQNRASKSILGYKEFEDIATIYGEKNSITLQALMHNSCDCGGKCDDKEFEVWLKRSDGVEIICDLSLTRLYNENAESYALIWLFQDISDKKAKERLLHQQSLQLEYQAYHDTLTGLPNRALFRDRLKQTIAYAKRNGKKFALLFIDLDKFKQINDSFGHLFGDDVLLEVAKRLSFALRDEDTLARISGDEFTIIAQDIHVPQDAGVIAQKILDLFREPLVINSQKIYATLSVGISLYPDDAEDMVDLIKYADSAMYRSKENGRNQYSFYTQDLTMNAFEKVVIENSLRESIQKDAFEVYYQPQVDIVQKRVYAVEALVRWNHPHLGMLSPARFLPIAEESGLLVEIDRIVMKKALKQFASWKRSGIDLEKISLNLAVKQLYKSDFLTFLQEQLEQNSFEPSWLEFELTESDVMTNPALCIETLQKIHEMGISIALDDFGTGYSSLAYLTKFPIDKIKLDKSFVEDIVTSQQSKEIVRAMIALAKSLEFDIVAEGVEYKEQLEVLRKKECTKFQGFMFSKPLSSSELETFLQRELL